MNLGPPDCPCLVHPLCIVWWKPGCPCMAVCLYPRSSSFLFPHLGLECGHASSTCIYVHLTPHHLAQPPMYSYMENWLPLCGSVFVSQSPHACDPDTLFRMCTCISTWIYVHLTVLCLVHHPMHCIMKTSCTPVCVTVYVYASHPACGPTPCLECVHASGHVFMSILLPMH